MPISDIIWTPDDSPMGIPQALGISPAPAGTGVMLVSFGTPAEESYILIAGSAEIPDVVVFTGFNAGGFGIPLTGAIAPSDFEGVSIFEIGQGVSLIDPLFTYSGISLNGTLPADFITSITVNGTTLLTSDATFVTDGTHTSWAWFGLQVFPLVGVYDVQIN